MNQVNLVGRMTRDAEDIGNPVVGVRFAVATDDYDPSTKNRETEFHECVAFGNVKDVIKNYAGKGREVRVTGLLRSRKYTPSKGPRAGIEITEKNVIVEVFELLAGKPASPATNLGSEVPGNGDGEKLW